MTGKNNQTIPVVFPLTGKSRFSAFKKFSPVSRETFCKLSNEGKAPQPERLGSRYLQELHHWLSDPANYQVEQKNQIA